MAIQLFGFSFGKKNSADEAATTAKTIPSFVSPSTDDGTIELAPGGAYGTFVDLEGTAKNESELIMKYREMSLQPEVESAIDDIVNEAIVMNEEKLPINYNLENVTTISESLKNKMRDEFEYLSNLLNIQRLAYEIFKRWYVDGRLYYHMMIDTTKPALGIQELRYIDPRRIKKIRIPIKKSVDSGTAANAIVPAYHEFYAYTPARIGSGNVNFAQQQQTVKISPASICYINSGMIDFKTRMILSHLHKAIKPTNQLRMLEDAVVIYRISRAPERRIFYIDVGNLPKIKAEQYLRDMMVKHKNRLVYDATTGETRDDRKFMTMLEDFWLPRREGGRGTEITTLAGGQNLGEMEDVNYFRKKLYKALNVPATRLEAETTSFNMGRSSEITRDELKFNKFVKRIRMRFSELFDILMETQLALKGIMSLDDYRKLKADIRYDFVADNHFTELKKQELITGKITLLTLADPFVGKYVSHEWAMRNIMHFTEEDIALNDKELAKEADAIAQQATEQPPAADEDDEQEQKPPSNVQKESYESTVKDLELIKSMTAKLDDHQNT